MTKILSIIVVKFNSHVVFFKKSEDFSDILSLAESS